MRGDLSTEKAALRLLYELLDFRDGILRVEVFVIFFRLILINRIHETTWHVWAGALARKLGRGAGASQRRSNMVACVLRFPIPAGLSGFK
jgi:hypothetical protein